MDYMKQQTEYDGVACWHVAGYSGKGIAVWDMENGKTDHGQLTRQRVLDAAPGATVINASYSNTNGRYAILDDGSKYTVEDFVERNRIKILTRSMSGGFCKPDGKDAAFWLDLQRRYNLIILNSAGNTGDDKSVREDVAIRVGACGFYKAGRDKWELRRDSYSSTGAWLDFVDFRGSLALNQGTSFAVPYLAGKIALLCERYGNLTQDQVYTYLCDHAEDIPEVGKDVYTGWGLPILGDPEEYYFGGNNMTVTMRIGSAVMDVNGKQIIMDETPQYNRRGDRMMVPIKYVAEAFGCKTEWDEKTKTVRFVR